MIGISIMIKETNRAYNADVMAKNRLRKNVEARMALAYRLRHRYKYSFEKIGTILNKDHATIMHYCTKHEDLFMYDNDYFEKYSTLVKKTNTTKRWLCREATFEIKRANVKI